MAAESMPASTNCKGVMVSSTFKTLEQHRAALMKALQKEELFAVTSLGPYFAGGVCYVRTENGRTSDGTELLMWSINWGSCMSHRYYILQDHLIHLLIASVVLWLVGALSILSARAEAGAGQSKTKIAVEIDADSAIGKKVLSYLVRELGEIPEFEVVSSTEKPAYVFMMLAVQETDNSDQPVGYALSTLIVEPTY